MNKILMDGDKYFLEGFLKTLSVKGNATLYINNLDNIDLEINLDSSSSLTIYDFSSKTKKKKITVKHENNSQLRYFHGFKINDEYEFFYKSIINGNDNVDDLNISGVTSGSVLLDIDGIAKEKTKNNIINENIKVLTVDGKCTILPKLHISTKEIMANHNTAISNCRDDELFYLMSKGIEKKAAIKLIEDGYIYGFFKDEEEFYKLIKE